MLGYKTLQSWLKHCHCGEIILYAENFVPEWKDSKNITNWDDSYYNRLKVVNLELSDTWSTIRQQLTGRAKNFVWKAAAWEHAVTTLSGTVTFFDADLICFREPKIILEMFNQENYDASIMSVKDIRPHADSCFYSINTAGEHARLIVSEYMDQYKIAPFTPQIYPKPYDAPVYSKTLDNIKDKIKIWDFNTGSDAKSPLKDTILKDYFRHLKGNQKDSGRILGLIDKTINALDKGKSVEDILVRFDRKLRSDDSKKLDLPF